MNTLQEVEQKQIEKLTEGKPAPEFAPGDTVRVSVKVVEGERTRIQAYEGVFIGRAGSGLNENFTVRKISYGVGVERVFPDNSPNIDRIAARGMVFNRAPVTAVQGVRAHQKEGRSDDLVALTALLGLCSRHITPQIRDRAQRRLDQWFPGNP